MGEVKLNLGSGTSRYEDYLSVDYYVDGVDVVHDLTKPLPYDDATVDAIYSSHVVEHFSRDEWEDVRQDWARVLKPGGTIEIRTPDIVAVSKDLFRAVDEGNVELQELSLTRMYGDQGHPGGFHKNGFTAESLVTSFPGLIFNVLEPSTEYELHMRFTK